jgi:hypothetical protein
MFQPTRLLPVLVFLASISLAACGGSGSSTALNGTSAAPAANTSGTPTSTNAGYAISGVVSGATGVTVNLAGSAATTTTTDSSGNFNFATLDAGNYTLRRT